MNLSNQAMVLQYVLDHLSNAGDLSLNVNRCSISIRKDNKIEVTRTTDQKIFEIENPQCGEEIVKFVTGAKPKAIYLNMDEWFKAISQKDLEKIIDPENEPVARWGFVYDEIWNSSMSYDCHRTYDGFDYWLDRSESAMEDFITSYWEDWHR